MTDQDIGGVPPTIGDRVKSFHRVYVTVELAYERGIGGAVCGTP